MTSKRGDCKLYLMTLIGGGPGSHTREKKLTMTTDEMFELLIATEKQQDEITERYRRTGILTRRDANTMRHLTQRVGLVACEMWIRAGKPDDPTYDCLREPIPLNPLPKSMTRQL